MNARNVFTHKSTPTRIAWPLRNRSNRRRVLRRRIVNVFYVSAFTTCVLHLINASRTRRLRLLVVILAARRPDSFHRLFNSLVRARYSHAVAVDLFIHVDGPEDVRSRERTLEKARSLRWPHGEKFVVAERTRVGLRKSWLRVSPRRAHTHVAIFEDDMELSPLFYEFIKHVVVASNGFSDEKVAALCLHPGDWEVRVFAERDCEPDETPRVQFYHTPEPCNWGPVWSSASWMRFKRWALDMERAGTPPYAPAEIGFNYNEYLKLGRDVQSSWVWRYNWETDRVQLRYTVTCFDDPSRARKYHMAVNHREPGVNFARRGARAYHESLTDSLARDSLVDVWGARETTTPIEFRGYASLSALLPPP